MGEIHPQNVTAPKLRRNEAVELIVLGMSISSGRFLQFCRRFIAR
jgi:hypothetical protein